MINNLINKYKLNLLKIERALWMIVFLSISISSNAFANSENRYCISVTEPVAEAEETVEYSEKNKNYLPKIINSFSLSQKYKINVIEEKHIKLIDREDSQIISSLNIPLEEQEYIEVAFIMENNLLFLSTTYENYIVEIDSNTSVFKWEESTKLTRYYTKKCSGFRKWLEGNCGVGAFVYSPTLNSVFLSGYSDLGLIQRWKSIEINVNTGEIKPILPPKPIRPGLTDLATFNGVLFIGFNDEIIFYDGNNFEKISLYLDKKKLKYLDYYRLIKISNVPNLKNLIKERIFVTDLIHGKETPGTLIEIKSNLSQTPILVPKGLDRKNILKRFTYLPEDLRLLMITKNSILFEMSDEYKTLLSISQPYQIPTYVSYKKYTEAIPFDIVNKQNKLLTTFYIKRVSSNANCKLLLDPNKPTVLSPELINQ